MRRLAFVLLSLTLVGGVVSRAHANTIFGCPIVIDDFTQGALQPAHGPFEYTHVGLPAQNCAGGSRHVVIDAVPTHLAGMIPLGGGDIGYQIQTSEHGPGNDVFEPDVLLDYAMAQPLDLTAGGTNDRIQLDVVSATYMSVLVFVHSPGKAAGRSLLLQPGTNEILLSHFAPYLDLTQVSRIQLYFNEYSVDGTSEVTLSRIRVNGNGRKFLYLDLPLLVEIGPPFPLPGPLMEAVYQEADGAVIQTTPIGLVLESATVLAPGPLVLPFPTSMRASDSGLVRQGGLSAGFEFVEAASGKSSHSDGAFAFSIGVESAGSHFPSRVLVPDAVDPGSAKTFLIPFDVEVLGATGFPVGTHSMRLRVQVKDDVPYEITNIGVVAPSPPTVPSFGFSFEIHDDGTAGKRDEGQELFDIALEGDFVPYAAPTTSSPVVLPGGLKLSASPSVVSDRTVLQMSRGLDRPASVRIYDLAGRAVRTLRFAAGQQMLTWDTRDDDGRSVASGVYVARVDAGAEAATRKLVVVH